MLRDFVRLFSYGTPKGGVVFQSLVVGKNNSECLPDGILTIEEVEEVRRQLCRLPQINKGRVGEYTWKASNKELPTATKQTDQNRSLQPSSH